MKYILSWIFLCFGAVVLHAQTDVTFYGVGAGDSNLGNNNTGFGKDVLKIATGGDNVAIGVGSLGTNTTGNSNTGVGTKTLRDNTAGIGNVAIGKFSMLKNTTGRDNIAIGAFTLDANTTGKNNMALGYEVLTNNTTGIGNVGVGYAALKNNVSGINNVGIGRIALFNCSTGGENTVIGYRAMQALTSGNENVAIGYEAGVNTIGDRNVFIGYEAGYNETGSDKLYVANSKTNTILFGDFVNGNIGVGTTNPTHKLQVNHDFGTSEGEYSLFQASRINAGNDNAGIVIGYHADGTEPDYAFLYSPGTRKDLRFQNNAGGKKDVMTLTGDGDVGIGTTSPDEKLAVKGKIHAEEVKVDLNVPWPDYVFDDSYTVMPLNEVDMYIKENGHLPNIPSANEVKQEGILLADMNVRLLKKVEELTLYLIEQNEKIKYQSDRIYRLENQIKE